MSGINDGNGSVKSINRKKYALIAGLATTILLSTLFVSFQAKSDANPIATANAQTVNSTPYISNRSTISTSGTATTKVQPDKFSVMIGVQTNASTASQAADDNAKLMSTVISAIKGLGISDNQISTSDYSVSPIYTYKQCPYPYCPQSQQISGYQTTNTVTVTLDTNSIDAGKVIDTAVKAGANNVSVNFFVSDAKQQAIRDNLTATAIANARHRADIAASSLGMQVSGVQSVNLNDVYFPVYRNVAAPMAAEGSATPIQPGQQDVSTNVSIVFYIDQGPVGATSIRGSNCTNPPGGPMIC